MPLFLNIDGERSESQLARLGDGSYELQGEGVSSPLLCPLSLTYDLDPDGYDVYVLFSGEIRESDIYQIYVSSEDGDRRIGWFFSLLSLESNLHDFADDEHFLRYARAAIEDFFDVFPQDVADATPSVSVGNGLRLTSFAPESTVLLVISRKVLAGGAVFDLGRLYPYLSSVGVLDNRQSKGGHVLVPFVRPKGKRLKLIHSSAEFANDKLVAALLTYAAHAFSNPVLQFFYLYQVVELLMEKVFSNEQKAIVVKINQANGAVSKVKEAMDDLAECLSEKQRINAVVDKYCNPAPPISDLIRSCRYLNSSLGIKEGETLAKSLYPLRNLVFHNYRSFPDHNLDDLNRINHLFFSAIPHILGSFRSPVEQNGP
ncbi:hypothetical protein [Rhodanobacter sp. Root480]|uniref:hypothetical protein n=1 Tax=Rhodanobacter sp. Root480 TaxID=1736542 RepID=UPI000ABC41AD|nr:hypothetical protein [Rhodanobacter sp. Root480]